MYVYIHACLCLTVCTTRRHELERQINGSFRGKFGGRERQLELDELQEFEV